MREGGPRDRLGILALVAGKDVLQAGRLRYLGGQTCRKAWPAFAPVCSLFMITGTAGRPALRGKPFSEGCKSALE